MRISYWSSDVCSSDLPRDEVKSVSRPPEPAIKPTVNQKKLASRLLDLTRNGRVAPENVSRFKYLLAHAKPSHRLNARLLKVLHRHPDHAPGISRYIAAYATLPDFLAKENADRKRVVSGKSVSCRLDNCG